MDLKVTAKKWGNYSKGDVIKNAPNSTAEALIKAKVVEENTTKKETKKGK